MAERFGILCTATKLAAPPRTAHALTRHGAEVCIVAPPDSYVALTRFKKADILMPVDELGRKLPAVARTLAEDFGAHSILAGDDGAFVMLVQLAAQMNRLELSDATRGMLSRSVPSSETALQLVSDSAFITGQRSSLCAPPRSIANPTLAETLQFARKVGYPLMVKADGGAGGSGVTRCQNQQQLIGALNVPRVHRGLVVQEFMPGPVYGVAVSGISGKAAAAFAFAKHMTLGTHGVATVLKHEPRDDIIDHARLLYERYELNGYCGIDYIADAAGRPHLLEINRCIVPKSHFSRAFGVDLTLSMLSMLRGLPTPSPAIPEHEYVALFPLEWMRDPASSYLGMAFHDVPWEDQAVLAAIAKDIGGSSGLK